MSFDEDSSGLGDGLTLDRQTAMFRKEVTTLDEEDNDTTSGGDEGPTEGEEDGTWKPVWQDGRLDPELAEQPEAGEGVRILATEDFVDERHKVKAETEGTVFTILGSQIVITWSTGNLSTVTKANCPHLKWKRKA